MLGRSKGKQPIVSSDESDTEPEGVYQHTRTRTGVKAPVDYSALAQGSEVSESHSAIVESQASNSSVKKEAFAYMASTPEEMARRFEQQAQAQREQLDMIRAQQESIVTLKQMLSQLLEGKKKLKAKTPSKKFKGKWKERESSSSARIEEEEQSNSESSKPPSEEGGDSENGSTHSKMMNKLEQHIESLANRKGFQEAGVVRPYPAEWDLFPYPPKCKGSPNQHIHYFKSQTGNVVANDAILASLFIGTLKGLTFEWFMKLPEGSIKNWDNLEKLFLTRFFEDDSRITMPTFQATRQQKG